MCLTRRTGSSARCCSQLQTLQPDRLASKENLYGGCFHRRLSLQIFRLQSCGFGDACEHAWANFLAIMEGPGEALACATHELPVRAGYAAFQLRPSDSLECLQDSTCATAWPSAHAAANWT